MNDCLDSGTQLPFIKRAISVRVTTHLLSLPVEQMLRQGLGMRLGQRRAVKADLY